MERLSWYKEQKKISILRKLYTHIKSEVESCSVVSHSLRHHGPYSPWNSPGQNAGVGSLSLLQVIFPTQGLNPGLPYCRCILYHLNHQGSPRILEWVAYPFSRGSSQPRNRTGISWILYQLSYQGTNNLVNSSQSTNFRLSPTAFTPIRPTLLPIQEHGDCLLIRLPLSAGRLESTPHLTVWIIYRGKAFHLLSASG